MHFRLSPEMRGIFHTPRDAFSKRVREAHIALLSHDCASAIAAANMAAEEAHTVVHREKLKKLQRSLRRCSTSLGRVSRRRRRR